MQHRPSQNGMPPSHLQTDMSSHVAESPGASKLLIESAPTSLATSLGVVSGFAPSPVVAVSVLGPSAVALSAGG